MQNKVVVYLKSGQALKFTCKEFVVTKSADNEITKLSWEGIEPSPLYVRLVDISAVIVEVSDDAH